MALSWLYRVSFYRRIQISLLLFLIIPLLFITGLSYVANKQANEDNVRMNMKGIIGILAGDLSKTANDVTYTVNQYSASQSNGLLDSLRELSNLKGFDSFESYRTYTRLNESAALQAGKLSLAHVSVFFINRAHYPIIGTLNGRDAAMLRKDSRFEHLTEEEASTGIVRWFRAERGSSYGDVFSASYYLFVKKTVYDPFRGLVLGTLFVGIPDVYFQGLFSNAGDGVFTLYEADGSMIAGMDSSPLSLSDGPADGWMRETTAVPGTSWTLTYDINAGLATGDVTQRFWYLIMAVCIVMFVFLFMSGVIAKGLNKPIQKLMRIASQYGEGNSSIRYHAEGQDEISNLGQSINSMLDNINALIRKVEAEQEEKRTIELYALFSQIQPHFLLNTLNSIKCNLAIEGDKVHSETIDSLMALLRAHLRVHEPLTLADECKLLGQYVSIMRMRNRLPIELIIDIPDWSRKVVVPRLLLQPLVENSIIHGFSHSTPNPRIEVTVQEAEGGFSIQVADNGKGMAPETAEALNRKLENEVEQVGERGVGMYNAMRRLKLTFGDNARLLVRQRTHGGFAAVLYIPWNEFEGKDYADV
ncbi:sensor histidine kinase [Paenibacillus sp. GCM10023248]|uniref:sensor histidine kinase n=1 Tax=unclassified Paenibacillus TaxID=185978 RepID=UPI002378411C|nr:sensor histidine kinase [Paenibacillus sp. MAHUQ-63]MDD9267122.1 sensor histidine kinase [Paenibacillus sp. MAHUQ-63]